MKNYDMLVLKKVSSWLKPAGRMMAVDPGNRRSACRLPDQPDWMGIPQFSRICSNTSCRRTHLDPVDIDGRQYSFDPGRVAGRAGRELADVPRAARRRRRSPCSAGGCSCCSFRGGVRLPRRQRVDGVHQFLFEKTPAAVTSGARPPRRRSPVRSSSTIGSRSALLEPASSDRDGHPQVLAGTLTESVATERLRAGAGPAGSPGVVQLVGQRHRDCTVGCHIQVVDVGLLAFHGGFWRHGGARCTSPTMPATRPRTRLGSRPA